MTDDNLVYVVTWNYEDGSGVNAVFSNQEAAEKYKEEKESADNFNIKYSVVRYVLHH